MNNLKKRTDNQLSDSTFIKFIAKWKYILGAFPVVLILVLLIAGVYNQTPLTSQPGLQLNSSVTSSTSYGTSQYNSFLGGLQIPYVTYQFASWGGGGWSFGQGVTDSQMQQQQAMGTSILPWEGRAGWCSNANTSSSNIQPNDPIYGSSISTAIVKYETPFLIQEPLDSYGSECIPWGQQVVQQFPGLMTYDYNGTPLTSSRMAAIGKDYIRVDSLDFSRQIYNDLVNIYNNMMSTNPNLVNYWYGIEVGPGIYADHGDLQKPGANIILGSGFATDFYWSNQTVVNFANSPQCIQHYSNCSTLLYFATGGANTYTIAKTIANNDAKWFGLWLDYELFLGLSYAAYNFTHNYQINHPFIIHASFDYSGASLLPSSYPYPYNTQHIENLNLFNNFVINGVLDYENGNPPSRVSVSYDESVCRSDLNQPNSINGFLITGTYANIKNMIYFEPFCAATSIMEPMNLPYTNPANPMIQLLMDYGMLLNRMSYVGIGGQFTASVTSGDPTTGVTVLGGNGYPLLLWFYTNSTTGDHATINLNLNNYNIGQNGWIAISALDWSVVGSGTGSMLSLNVRIPSQGWNPVYVFNNNSASPTLLYTNLRLTSSANNQTTYTYTFTGPHELSGWTILRVASQPSLVVASNSGIIQQYQTLKGLNGTFVGMYWNGNSWSNRTQTGWYYDPGNQLLYVHFVGDNKVSLSVSFSSSNQSGRLSISSSTSFLTITQGNSDTLSLTVSSYAVSSQEVTLSALQLPSGLSLAFTPNLANTNFTSTLSIYVSNWTRPGNYNIIVQANSSTLLASTLLSLTVLASQISSGGGQQSENNTGSVENQNSSSNNQERFYTLSIASGPIGFGSTSPNSGLYQLPSGTMVNITAKPADGWMLGSWYVNGNYAGNGSVISFLLTSDIKVLALFVQSDKIIPSATVSIESNQLNIPVNIDGKNYSLPVSFNWALGSIHNISANQQILVSPGERISFNRWSGSINSYQSSFNLTIVSDAHIIAEYSPLYEVNISFVDADSKPLLPTEAFFSSSFGILQLHDNFSFWSQNGLTYSLVGANWAGTSVSVINSSNATFTVTGPSSVVIGLNVHSSKIKVQDIFGQPIKGAEVSVLLPNGTEVHAYTNSSGLAYFSQLPEYGYQLEATYLGTTFSVQPNYNIQGMYYITLALSYPVIEGIMAIFASLSIALFLAKLRRILPERLKVFWKQAHKKAELE